MLVPDSPDASQLDGEGDSSDKPPHDTPTPRPINTSHGITQPTTNGGLFSIPLPPPDSASYAKEPGHTVRSLEKLVLSGSEHMKQESGWPAAGSSPSTSPSVSESEWSAPSTSPPSHAPSRAASMSEAVKPPAPKADQPVKPNVEPQPSSTVTARRPSVHSDSGGIKFALKDLLASGPKLARKSSARSTSSRRSDSDGDRKSTAGDSTASLSKKYGVCQKVAIGKGATSVVRLAHKWDRSEEKLYAVKVRDVHIFENDLLNVSNRNSENEERMKQKKNTSRNSRQSSAYHRHCIIQISSKRSTSSKMSRNTGAK
jgi:protein-serine/threonine kinase